MALKKQLRANVMARRTALTDDEYIWFNNALLQQFKTLDFTGIKCLHIFLPLYKRREPDTNLLIAWLQEHHPEIKIAYPRANMASNTLLSYLQDERLVLEANSWGVTEPISGTLIEPGEIDAVIIPLLAFDKRGYRVGYGKGFYDRFLAQCKPGAQFIGLSQFEPVDEIEDVDAFDIPLHRCVMPGGVYELPC